MSKRKFTTPAGAFDSISSDLKITNIKADRDLKEELFNEEYQQKVIDAFEERIGIKPKAVKTANLIYKNRLFNLSLDGDSELLNKLMNDPKYAIVKWSESFTASGDFLVFAIYSDNLDLKDK